ncbi:MAG: acyltransferase [Patescibacteria group bacterium]|jgi:peptidoglycan/LPS O-acetylase OafA/YrhL
MNPIIELYRGIAALMVMACHYRPIVFGDERNWLSFLWTGVDFFFVISGFVFAPHIASGKIQLRSFSVRRFFRIYPLYFLSLWIYFFLRPDDPNKLHYLFNHLGMLHTLHSKEEAFFFNPAYWSLPPEIEFYLLLPLLALWVRSSLNKLLWIMLFALITNLVLFTLHLENQDVKIFSILTVHLPVLLIEFLLGVLTFHFSQSRPLAFAPALVLLAIATGALGYLGWYFVKFGDAGISNHPILKLSFNLFCALAYAIILGVSVNLANQRVPSKKLLIVAFFGGQISYSVYLLHNAMPLLFARISMSPLPRFFLCSLVTITFAFILNKLYEHPLHQLGITLSKRLGSPTKQ